MNTFGTLGEAIDDAFDWLTESGFDPTQYSLKSVVSLHYTWHESGQYFTRREGHFQGLYR